MDLPGIEPGSMTIRSRNDTTIPVSWLTAPTRRIEPLTGPDWSFPVSQWSSPPPSHFRPVIPRFCCQAAVNRPRAPLLVTMSLYIPKV